jgi:hypothetical protein
VEYGVMIFFIIFVLGFSKLLIKRKKAKSAKHPAPVIS